MVWGIMTEKPSARLPSLNQLAARINVNSTAPNAATASRPRLAVGNLRTSSSSSLASTATTTDSVAVQPSTTRSASPDPDDDNDLVPKDDTADNGLTSEKLEQLNAATTKKDKVPAGYKNIPSLDAIARRMHQLSVDGTHRPPEPELVEDPKTPGIKVKAPEHPLQYTWYEPLFSIHLFWLTSK